VTAVPRQVPQQPLTFAGLGDGAYVARVARHARGWTAFLVELTYAVGASEPLKLTTAVRIVPDDLPHGAP
jgi:hypothetical protein